MIFDGLDPGDICGFAAFVIVHRSVLAGVVAGDQPLAPVRMPKRMARASGKSPKRSRRDLLGRCRSGPFWFLCGAQPLDFRDGPVDKINLLAHAFLVPLVADELL